MSRTACRPEMDGSTTLCSMKTITRTQAIQGLRRELGKLVDEDHSLCLVATRRGLFCGGFERWSDEELRQRLPREWQSNGAKTRAELLRLANRWMLGLRELHAGSLPCDPEADSRCRSPFCFGWAQFSDNEIGQFHQEMCGEEIRVVPDGDAGAEEGI